MLVVVARLIVHVSELLLDTWVEFSLHCSL